MTESNDDTRSGAASRDDRHVREATGGEPVATQVVVAVSDVLGTAADDLRPIAEVLDADALNGLFDRDRGADVTVQFEYERCSVVVDDETIAVEPPRHSLSAE